MFFCLKMKLPTYTALRQLHVIPGKDQGSYFNVRTNASDTKNILPTITFRFLVQARNDSIAAIVIQ